MSQLRLVGPFLPGLNNVAVRMQGLWKPLAVQTSVWCSHHAEACRLVLVQNDAPPTLLMPVKVLSWSAQVC